MAHHLVKVVLRHRSNVHECVVKVISKADNVVGLHSEIGFKSWIRITDLFNDARSKHPWTEGRQISQSKVVSEQGNETEIKYFEHAMRDLMEFYLHFNSRVLV